MKRKKQQMYGIFDCGALALLLACALLAGCESKVTLKLVTYDGNFTVLEGKAGEIADFPAVMRDGYALEGWYEDKTYVQSAWVRACLKRTGRITPNG